MTSEFVDDLLRLRAELSEARRDFLAIVDSVAQDKLDGARRGGWSARRVLDHVISSEQAYARVIGHLRRQPIESEVPPGQPASIEDAKAKLSSAREALLGALEGVDEDSFYSLQQIGHEEYSILSVLENARSHDHEHGQQLSEILRGS